MLQMCPKDPDFLPKTGPDDSYQERILHYAVMGTDEVSPAAMFACSLASSLSVFVCLRLRLSGHVLSRLLIVSSSLSFCSSHQNLYILDSRFSIGARSLVACTHTSLRRGHAVHLLCAMGRIYLRYTCYNGRPRAVL